jgi:hypothetical protein
MATRTINLRAATEHYRKLGARFWPTVMIGAKAGGERARAHMVEASQEAFDRGGYTRAWKASVEGRSLTIYNQAPYAAVIEHGRRPGGRMPPVKALVPWVRRKLGVGDAEAQSVAFLVARKIARDGTPGKQILSRAEDALVELVRAEVIDAVRRAVGIR